MLIRKIHLKKAVDGKIGEHGVAKNELKDTFQLGEPKYAKARNRRYMAIGRAQRFITIIFEYNNGIATIVTAYPSSEWQIKLYHRK